MTEIRKEKELRDLVSEDLGGNEKLHKVGDIVEYKNSQGEYEEKDPKIKPIMKYIQAKIIAVNGDGTYDIELLPPKKGIEKSVPGKYLFLVQ